MLDCPRHPRILWEPPGELAESDCACVSADVAYHRPRPRGFTGLWQIPPNLYRAPLTDDHELVFNPVGEAGVVVLNRPASVLLEAYSRPRPLEGPWAYQLASLDILRPQGEASTYLPQKPKTLTAWLHVTNACNLRCSYCYVTKTREMMDQATGLAAVEAVFRAALAHDFRAVKLKYAGGEPTLNFKLIVRLHEHARALAARHKLTLRAVVLSNGVALKPEMLTWLKNEGVRLMISLDGVGSAHDAQRAFADGRGSFAFVVRGIKTALALGIRPSLSITVTAHTVHHLTKVVAFALDHDLPFNLNFYRDWSNIPSAAAWRAESEQLVRGMRAAFKVIEARLPRRRLIDALVDRSAFNAPHARPCGAGHHYLVVDHRGRIARCHMEIERPVTDIFAQDPLSAVHVAADGFRNIPVDERTECRTCTWRYWCAGGCPLLTHRVTGRDDVQSPYCEVYRALYPDVLRLEGLRLLKWAAS